MSHRLLVVDDEEPVRQVLKRFLTRKGFSVLTAVTDIETARQTIKLGAYDYILKLFDLTYLETALTAKLFLMTS